MFFSFFFDVSWIMQGLKNFSPSIASSQPGMLLEYPTCSKKSDGRRDQVPIFPPPQPTTGEIEHIP